MSGLWVPVVGMRLAKASAAQEMPPRMRYKIMSAPEVCSAYAEICSVRMSTSKSEDWIQWERTIFDIPCPFNNAWRINYFHLCLELSWCFTHWTLPFEVPRIWSPGFWKTRKCQRIHAGYTFYITNLMLDPIIPHISTKGHSRILEGSLFVSWFRQKFLLHECDQLIPVTTYIGCTSPCRAHQKNAVLLLEMAIVANDSETEA